MRFPALLPYSKVLCFSTVTTLLIVVDCGPLRHNPEDHHDVNAFQHCYNAELRVGLLSKFCPLKNNEWVKGWDQGTQNFNGASSHMKTEEESASEKLWF